MKEKLLQSIRDLSVFIYGENSGGGFYSDLLELLKNENEGDGISLLSCRDVLLITYGDMLSGVAANGGESGLRRLYRFLSTWNKDFFSLVHLLPFHPYSSDDGFSVIDYREVDGRFGSWDDIAELGRDYKLVFDFVLNHGSVQASWFKSFLNQEEKYSSWYCTRPADYDSSMVVRPRTHPLLTPFTLKDGTSAGVWTTFSTDQADYDFSNPDVLLEFASIFLEYVRRGSRIVRLDAIAYLWKEDNTPCIHHPKTHAVVKLFRSIIEALSLDMRILTETNVPHAENVSYFGNGDEANMVYNFALPPLVLHAAISQDAAPLREWARGLDVAEGRVFLNFLASHDGVGLTPAKGLVDEAAFNATIEEAQRRGALVSYKSTPDGKIPYELNCSYATAVAPPSMGNVQIRSKAFLATQAVLLAFRGLPAVYFHSWLGSEAWEEGPALLGANRAINREKPLIDKVEKELRNNSTFRSAVYEGYGKLLSFRKKEPAFDPASPQAVLDSQGAIFAIVRGPDKQGRSVLCAHNLGSKAGELTLPDCIPLETKIPLEPYEVRWIAF